MVDEVIAKKEPEVRARISSELLNFDSKKKLADVSISVNANKEIQVRFTSNEHGWRDTINGIPITDELRCMLSTVKYGDMDLFVAFNDSQQGTYVVNSAGHFELHTEIVDTFPCKGNSNGTEMLLTPSTSMT